MPIDDATMTPVGDSPVKVQPLKLQKTAKSPTRVWAPALQPPTSSSSSSAITTRVQDHLAGPTPWPMPQSTPPLQDNLLQQPMDLTAVHPGKNIITLQERTVTVTPQEAGQQEIDPELAARIQQKMAEQMQAAEHAIRQEFGQAAAQYMVEARDMVYSAAARARADANAENAQVITQYQQQVSTMQGRLEAQGRELQSTKDQAELALSQAQTRIESQAMQHIGENEARIAQEAEQKIIDQQRMFIAQCDERLASN